MAEKVSIHKSKAKADANASPIANQSRKKLPSEPIWVQSELREIVGLIGITVTYSVHGDHQSTNVIVKAGDGTIKTVLVGSMEFHALERNKVQAGKGKSVKGKEDILPTLTSGSPPQLILTDKDYDPDGGRPPQGYIRTGQFFQMNIIELDVVFGAISDGDSSKVWSEFGITKDEVEHITGFGVGVDGEVLDDYFKLTAVLKKFSSFNQPPLGVLNALVNGPLHSRSQEILAAVDGSKYFVKRVASITGITKDK